MTSAYESSEGNPSPSQNSGSSSSLRSVASILIGKPVTRKLPSRVPPVRSKQTLTFSDVERAFHQFGALSVKTLCTATGGSDYYARKHVKPLLAQKKIYWSAWERMEGNARPGKIYSLNPNFPLDPPPGPGEFPRISPSDRAKLYRKRKKEQSPWKSSGSV